MNTIQPLRNKFVLDEDRGFVRDQIQQRVNSEDNFTWCKNFPLIKQDDIKGKLGEPLQV